MALAYVFAVCFLFVFSIMLFVDCKFPNRYYRKGNGRRHSKHDNDEWDFRTTSTPDIYFPTPTPDYEYDHKTEDTWNHNMFSAPEVFVPTITPDYPPGCNCDNVNQLISRSPWTPVYTTGFTTLSSHPWPPPKTTITVPTTVPTWPTTTVPTWPTTTVPTWPTTTVPTTTTTTTTTTTKRSTLPSAIKTTLIPAEMVKPDCKPLTKHVETVYALAWTSIIGAGFGGLALGVILTALFFYCRNHSANKQNSAKAEKIELHADKQQSQPNSTNCDQDSYYYTLDAEEGFKQVYENDPRIEETDKN